MQQKQFLYLVGFSGILISLVTWYMDLSGIVEHCIYCRCERTVIGILALILFLPRMNFFSKIISYALGFFGAVVASQQMFLIIAKHTINIELIFAACALVFIILQIALIIRRDAIYRVSSHPDKDTGAFGV